MVITRVLLRTNYKSKSKASNNLRSLVTFLRTTPNEITVTTHRDIISLSFLVKSSPVTQTEKCQVRRSVNFILSKRKVHIRSLEEQKEFLGYATCKNIEWG